MISLPWFVRRVGLFPRVAFAGVRPKVSSIGKMFAIALVPFFLSEHGVAQSAQFAGAVTILAHGYGGPSDLAFNSNGNLFVAEYDGSSILEIEAINGVISTSSRIRTVTSCSQNCMGIASDIEGDVYFTDGGWIREIMAVNGTLPLSPTIQTLYKGFTLPEGLAVEKTGNLLVTDFYNGTLSELVAVNGSVPVSPTIRVVASGYQGAEHIALDSAGDVFFTSYQSMHEVLAVNGAIPDSPTIVAILPQGAGGRGVAIDASGNIFFTGDGGDNEVYEIFAVGGSIPANPTIIRLGGGLALGLDAGDGLALDRNGNLFIANIGFSEVTELSPSVASFAPAGVGAQGATLPLIFSFKAQTTLGVISVVTQGSPGLDFANAQTGTCGANVAYGTGDSCTVNVTFSPRIPGSRNGSVVLSDIEGNIVATAPMTGTGIGPMVNFAPPAQSVPLSNLTQLGSIAVDGADNLYVSFPTQNTVLKETNTGGGYTQSLVQTPSLSGVSRIALGTDGSVFMTDTVNNRVVKEMPTGYGYLQSVVAAAIPQPSGVTTDGAGNVYIICNDGTVFVATPTTTGYNLSSGLYTGFTTPAGIAVDTTGALYIVSITKPGSILKETPSGGFFAPSTIAIPSGSVPTGIAVDGSNAIYVLLADPNTYAGQVLKESPNSTGYVQSIVPTQQLNQPLGITVDSRGNVFIADFGMNRVVELDSTDPPGLAFNSSPVGSTGRDSPQAVTLTNAGNADLTFPIPATGTNPSVATNFTFSQSTPGACPVIGSGFSTPGTLPAGSSCQLAVSFTPTVAGSLSGSLVLTDNNLNAPAPGYTTQSIALSGTATPATPTITWSAPAAITYGTALGAAQLNATASVPGTFAYSPAAGTVLGAGQHTLSVTFTPTDATDYTTAFGSVSITVNKATPTITWPTPAAIAAGTALSATQLNATANVPGTFVYNPAAGTVLSAGTQTLSVTFTPTDTTDYNTATASVQLTVNAGLGNGTPYSTNFPLTQNPISENGAWRNGKTDGVKWSDCQSTPGFAFGTQTGTADYDDSVCVLNGIWGANQAVQVTIKVNSTSSAQYDEVEVHLNTNIASNSITGYEISCSVVANDPYIQIARWNGAYGTFTALAFKSGTGCGNGTVLSAARSGNTITASINGTAVLSVNDSTYTAGYPGMGFYIQGLNGTAAAANAGFGVSSFSASDHSTATPTFTPAAGTYTSAQSVTIGDTTTGATIYYTTNGTTPTTSSSVYSTPISVSSTETLEAIAVAGGTQSAVATAAYTINLPAAAMPTFTPAAGTYTSAQSVSILDSTAGATIYYTTNGTTPTTSSAVYAGAISVSATETLKAIAVASGYSQSAVGTAAYTINQPTAATPTFTPAAGTYTSAQSVSILDSTAGATIYYTTNGSTPTTSSSVYAGAITVSATETLKAIAVASGYSQSAVGTAAYTINQPTAATPTFTPAAGTYTSAQSVAIADSTPGAIIYYTTNGTTPTTSSSVYSSAVSVGSSETIEAIAVAPGYLQSAVGSAIYTINIAGSGNAYSTSFPLTENPISENSIWTNGGSVGQKWSNCQTTSGMAFGTQQGASDYDDSVCVLTGAWGSNQSAQMTIKVNSTSGAQYDEVEIHLNTAIVSNSVTGYEINCSVVSGDPYMQIVRWNGALGSFKLLASKATGCTNGDVFGAARSGNTITAYKNGVAIFSTTDSTYLAGAPGMGFYIQNLNGSASTADAGFGASAFSATDRIAATPAFSLAAGTYTGAQTVSITDTTPGAKIYYTTNGTAPTTASALYATPITVSATETVEAIAVATGYAQSATASAKYTIK